jgi:hypothetical protein
VAVAGAALVRAATPARPTGDLPGLSGGLDRRLRARDAEELQAIVAHEIGHEYVSSDYERASELEDHRRLKNLELLCDAIAIVTLQRLGKNPQRLMAGVEKMDRYNQRLSRSTVNRTNYPTLSERRAFAHDSATRCSYYRLSER